MNSEKGNLKWVLVLSTRWFKNKIFF